MEYSPKTKRKCHPRDEAGFFSKLFFLYTINLFTKGYYRDLENSDLYHAPSALKSKKLGEQIERLWKIRQEQQKKPSMLLLLFQIHGRFYVFLGFSQLIVKTTVIILRPILVATFSSFFLNNQTDIWKTYASIYGFSLFVSVLVESWYDQWYSFSLTTLQIRIRAALISFFYRKCLKLSSFCTEDTTFGKILTLITKDVDNIEKVVTRANEIWTSVFQAIVLLFLLYRRIGFLIFVVIISFAIFLPVQIDMALKSTSLKTKMLKETDFRFELTKDLLLGFRIIKAYSWENFFKSKLFNNRLTELQLTQKIFLLKFIISIIGILWMCATFFLLMGICVALEREITSEIVFFMFESCQAINHLINITIPLSVCQVAETVASIRRIDDFLAIKLLPTFWQPNQNTRILLKNVSATIKKNTVLRNINLDLEKGLVLVTGPTSCGKSFLLKTILGECRVTKEKINIQGSISYASQKPWLFSSTIRQNILFGEEFEESRYYRVLKVCDLIYDFHLLENGDQTLIQNGGTNLSKGQQVRINLARALYKESDIYLLDDPLTPLDPQIRKYIFVEGICKLLQNKLVILVTQNSHLVKESKNSVVLNNSEEGFLKIIQQNNSTHHLKVLSVVESDITDEETELLPKSEKIVDFDESQKTGKVEYKVYRTWMKGGGGFLHFFLVICLLVFLPLTMRFLEKALNFWALNEEKIANHTKSNATDVPLLKQLLNTRRNVIAVDMVLVLCLFLSALVASVIFLSFNRRASIKLYKTTIKTIVGAKVHLLEENFFGNFLNKFSRDFLIIDEVVPFLFYDFYTMMVPMIAAVIVVLSADKIFLVFLIFLIFIFLLFKNVFLPVGRSLKRLEASSKSPVVGYFNSTLEGLTTIKSKNCTKIFQDEFDTHLDLYTSTSYTYLCTIRAFSLSIGWTYSIFFGIIITRFLATGGEPSDVSLAIFQTLLLTQIFNTVFLKWVEFETHMTSAERVLELAKLKQESGNGLVENWPKDAELKFENVSLFYNNRNRAVLSNLNFVIQKKEKIGIVGKSGAGKTSLIYTMLRLCDFEGKILVGDVAIKGFSLETLRSNISVIFQDPFIFKGTTRENLDPSFKHSDNEIWEVLDLVGLKKHIWDLNVDIFQTFVAFNSRQKRLLCLAKVIIENNSIVFLDDFIASSDNDVESLVCNLIKTTFVNCAMLIVTNNWSVLSCCDKVMVLEEGRIVEFGSPLVLNRKYSGILSQVIK